MRIHTSLSRTDMRDILRTSGAPIDYESISRHDSRTHPRAFEVRLTAHDGSASDWRNTTWDEWGAFLGALFDADPDARCGSNAKRPTYANATDFHQKTADRFRPRWVDIDTFKAHRTYLPRDAHSRHHWKYVPNAATFICTKCTAERSPDVPRAVA